MASVGLAELQADRLGTDLSLLKVSSSVPAVPLPGNGGSRGDLQLSGLGEPFFFFLIILKERKKTPPGPGPVGQGRR